MTFAILAGSMLPARAACPTFTLSGTSAVGLGPNHAVPADFNADGNIDVVFPNASTNTISVLMGNGDGTFSGRTDIVVGPLPVATTVADFNGDAKPDLAVPYGAALAVLLNHGDGTFASPVNYGSETFNYSAAGDFDGDGDLDLVAVNSLETAYILRNNGSGVFASAASYTVGESPTGVTTADFNGDSRRDIAVSNRGTDDVSVLLGNGDGTFASAVSVPIAGSGPFAIAAADVSGDGKIDLVTAQWASADLTVLLGNGNGTFGTAVLYPAGSPLYALTLADLNHDGFLDAVAPALHANDIRVFLGNGAGAFGAAITVPVGAIGPDGVAVADFDGDGGLDLVSANYASNSASMLLNQCFTLPKITAANPGAGPIAGGQNVILTGANLSAASTVAFDGVSVAFTANTATSITVPSTPAHAAGAAGIVVTAAAGTGPAFTGYTYAAPPTVASIAPLSGSINGGQTGVVITGTGLATTHGVTLGGAAATITNKSATTVTVTTPAHAEGVVDVVVSTGGGSATLSAAYTYVAPPAATSISPAAGPIAGGQTVIIGGTSLGGATSVAFGGVGFQGTITTNTATAITVTTPAHAAGAVTVTITTPNGTTTRSYTYAAVPTVSSYSPASGPAAGNQSVGFSGTALANAAVTFDGLAGSITSNSAVTIFVNTPAHAPGPVTLLLTTPGGSVTRSYTYLEGPTITSIVPNAGPVAGGPAGVMLTGTAMSGASSVKFDGTNATITNNTATSITVTPPAHVAGSVNVVVATSGGSATSIGGYFYAAIPNIFNVTSGQGPVAGGQTLSISGGGLANPTAVTFGGNAATVTSSTNGTINLVTPAHAAGSVDIVVTTAGGTVTSNGAYTYVAAPEATAVNPLAGPVAGGQTGVVISGANLSGTTSVKFGTTTATITNKAAGAVTVRTPAHAAGLVDLTIASPGGSATLTNAYTYVAAPAITALLPNRGPAAGAQSTILSGTNLANTTSVMFDGAAATITSNTAGSITLSTPVHAAGEVSVVVTTAGGTATTSYTYVAAPVVSSLAPNAGPTAGSQSVILGGSNLADATSVTFDGVGASITDNTAGTITVSTPVHVAGEVSVIVTTAGGTATTSYTYVAAPAIDSIAPNAGPTAGSQSVVLGGSNLTSATSVTFDGLAATITNNTAGSITVNTPPHAAGEVSVVVTTAGGTASAIYTYVTGPAIDSVTPKVGPTAGSQSVGLAGSNLANAESVTFDGLTATITNNTASMITVDTPSHAAGEVSVVVTTAGGSATTSYTYVAAPAIDSIAPNAGPTAGSQSVVLGGNNLTSATSVTFDGLAATITNNTASMITVDTPPHVAGPVNVVVTTPGGIATATLAYAFVAAPSIVSISPSVGSPAGGDTVVVHGLHLEAATAVLFGGSPAKIVSNDDESITVTTPPFAVARAIASGGVDVTVTTAGGSTTSSAAFVYAAAVAVTSVDPSSGPAIGGQAVVLSGSDLGGATSVTFGGAAATIIENTATTITVITPAHAAGMVDVIVTTGGGAFTFTNGYTYVAAAAEPIPALSISMLIALAAMLAAVAAARLIR